MEIVLNHPVSAPGLDEVRRHRRRRKLLKSWALLIYNARKRMFGKEKGGKEKAKGKEKGIGKAPG